MSAEAILGAAFGHNASEATPEEPSNVANINDADTTDTEDNKDKVLDDTTPLEVEKTYAGSFVVDVRLLELNNPQQRNRDLDQKLVTRLRDQFRHGIRRYAFADRLIVLTSRAAFMQIVNSIVVLSTTAQSTTATSTNDPLATTPPATQAESSEQALTPDQLKVVTAMRHRTQDKASADWTMGRSTTNASLQDKIPVATIPHDLAEPLYLLNGQHRVHALLSLVKPHEEASKFYWAVDCYIRDGMSPDVHRFLATNKDPVKKRDTEGYLAFHIITAFNEIADDRDRERLLKPEAMKGFLAKQFQYEMPKIGRLLAILRHDKWRDLVLKFCATKYGEETFAWHTMCDIVTARLDEIWLPIFRRFPRFASKAFPDDGASATSGDWHHIYDVLNPRSESTLRILFFPTADDYTKPKTPFPLPPGYKDDDDLPKLHSPVIGNDGLEHWNRRPGFLDRYNDEEYCDIYGYLLKNEEVECPKWSELAKLERTVSQKVIRLAQHVMKWVIPTWKKPGNASNQMQDLVWRDLFAKHIFRDGEEASRRNKAKKLICQIWTEVEDDPVWQDRGVVDNQLRKFPPGTWPTGLNTGQDTVYPEDPEIVRYLDRFQAECWSRIVMKVVEYAGPVLTGYMARFNDSNELARQFQTFNPSGRIAVSANWRDNQVLQKIPTILNPQSKAVFERLFTVAGALALYIETKRIMLNTLRNGMKYNAGRSSGGGSETIFRTKEEYDTARELLQQYAISLASYQLAPELDNFNEDLTQLDLDGSSPAGERRPPKLGFIKAEPGDYPIGDANARASRNAIAETALRRKTPTKKGRKRTINQVEDAENEVRPAPRLHIRVPPPSAENDQ